jgi:5-formyltetrahydrofolate cyclo-ligase
MDTLNGNGSSGVSKAALRRILRDRRARFTATLAPSVRALAFRVLPSPVLRRLPSGGTVALYHATGDEAPTSAIADQLARLGHGLALPRIESDGRTMAFASWHPDWLLLPGPFRMLQPPPEAPTVAPDVIIAPLVGFDSALDRLGQGGGFYDRAFAANPDALRIGLAWSVQMVERLPVEPLDLRLDLVVTEAAFYEGQGR